MAFLAVLVVVIILGCCTGGGGGVISGRGGVRPALDRLRIDEHGHIQLKEKK